MSSGGVTCRVPPDQESPTIKRNRWIALSIALCIIFTVLLVLFWRRRHIQPIKARHPLMVLIKGSACTLWVILLCLARIYQHDFPCWLYLWGSYVGTLVMLNVFMVRTIFLYADFNQTSFMMDVRASYIKQIEDERRKVLESYLEVNHELIQQMAEELNDEGSKDDDRFAIDLENGNDNGKNERIRSKSALVTSKFPKPLNLSKKAHSHASALPSAKQQSANANAASPFARRNGNRIDELDDGANADGDIVVSYANESSSSSMSSLGGDCDYNPDSDPHRPSTLTFDIKGSGGGGSGGGGIGKGGGGIGTTTLTLSKQRSPVAAKSPSHSASRSRRLSDKSVSSLGSEPPGSTSGAVTLYMNVDVDRMNKQLWFRIQSELLRKNALFKIMALTSVILLWPTVVTGISPTLRCWQGDQCLTHWMGAGAVLAVTAGLYMVGFIVLGNRIQKFKDSYNIRNELRLLGTFGLLALIPWYILNNVTTEAMRKFNDENSFSTLILIAMITSVILFSVLWPLVDTYVQVVPLIKRRSMSLMRTLPDVEEVQECADALRYHEARKVFTKHLERTWTVQHLHCWTDLQVYRRMVEKAKNAEPDALYQKKLLTDFQKETVRLFETYIRQGAGEQINISFKLRTKLEGITKQVQQDEFVNDDSFIPGSPADQGDMSAAAWKLDSTFRSHWKTAEYECFKLLRNQYKYFRKTPEFDEFVATLDEARKFQERVGERTLIKANEIDAMTRNINIMAAKSGERTLKKNNDLDAMTRNINSMVANSGERERERTLKKTDANEAMTRTRDINLMVARSGERAAGERTLTRTEDIDAMTRSINKMIAEGGGGVASNDGGSGAVDYTSKEESSDSEGFFT